MKIKSHIVGFEVPFFDQIKEESQIKLSQEISSKYLNWFDVLSCDLEFIKLDTGNILLLFKLIVKIDPDYTNVDLRNENWDKMTEDINASIDEFLKENDLEYRIWEEDDRRIQQQDTI